MEDREIIERILSGSIEDYRFLIERYQLRLQSTLSYYCMDKVEIEYYLHEAFVIVKVSQLPETVSIGCLMTRSIQKQDV